VLARRIITVVATVLFAFATGHVMQNGAAIGEQLWGPADHGVRRVQAAAPKPDLPQIAPQHPIPGSILPGLPMRAIPSDSGSPMAPADPGIVRVGFDRT